MCNGVITKDSNISYCAARWVKMSVSVRIRVHRVVGVDEPSKSGVCSRNWWSCKQNCPKTKDSKKSPPVREKKLYTYFSTSLPPSLSLSPCDQNDFFIVVHYFARCTLFYSMLSAYYYRLISK